MGEWADYWWDAGESVSAENMGRRRDFRQWCRAVAAASRTDIDAILARAWAETFPNS